jgi:hypothetical protein
VYKSDLYLLQSFFFCFLCIVCVSDMISQAQEVTHILQVMGFPAKFRDKNERQSKSFHLPIGTCQSFVHILTAYPELPIFFVCHLYYPITAFATYPTRCNSHSTTSIPTR